MEVTNPTNLALAITLPTLALADYEGLMAWADRTEKNYAGLVILEEQVAGTKTEMTELRRIAKQLDTSRIAAVKQVSAPIKDFEDKIKAVASRFNGIADRLGEQVKGYEERAREEKRQEVLFAIETLTTEAGYPGLEIPVQDSWLNKTQKPKQTAADIQAFIMRHIQAEKAATELAQAKQDRASSIEDACATQASAFGFSIPASTFLRLQSLETPLADARAEILRTYEAKAEAMQRVQNTAKAPAHAPPLDAFGRTPLAPQAAPAPQAPLGFRKGMTIHLEYEAHREAEVLAALAHLQGLCTDYVRHAKPLASSYGQPAAQRPVQRPY